MTTNPPEVKLCITCKHFVGGACEHSSNMKVSFVDGKMGTFNSVQFCRNGDKRPDGTSMCGPTGRFHERAPDPNGGYAEMMIRRDQRERLEGGLREHDLDIACRKLKVGS